MSDETLSALPARWLLYLRRWPLSCDDSGQTAL